MKLTPGTKMALSKDPAVGGNVGGMFDSGFNPSGVEKVRIECGSIKHNGRKYMNTIERIWIDFRCPTTDSPANVIFHGYPVHKQGNKIFTFKLRPDDKLVKAVVWSDGVLANAVQFHTESGIVSPMIGMPARGAQVTKFQGGCGSELVGVHGRFGGVIDKLGFSFATVSEIPIVVVGSLWTSDTADEESSAMGSTNMDRK
jgi:hypothetical protein